MNEWFELIAEPMAPEELGSDSFYPDMGELLPVTILCGISILLTALWLLVVCEYVWLRGRNQQ